MSRKLQFYLFILSIVVYLFYYISAYFTHTLDPFFVHATIGQDFFQIPNGAYAFLHGGTLTGSLSRGVAPYSSCCAVNSNVYHPLFTLLIGIPLQLFPPWIAMTIWALVHIAVMGGLVFFLWRKFHGHKYLFLALSFLLLNANNYYEIWLTQYHFLFTFFTVLFLYESMKYGDTKKAGLWLFFSLLVKPIGLLWILPLCIAKHYRTVLIGFGLFLFCTIPWATAPFSFGRYYLVNFVSVASSAAPTHNIYSITRLFPAIHIFWLKEISILVAGGLLLFQWLRKPNVFTVITLWLGYQLIFYTLVYHYHYSVLAGIFCLGILFNLPLKNRVVIPMLALTLPTPIIIFWITGTMSLLYKTDAALIWLYMIFWLVLFLVNTALSQKHKIILIAKE